MADSVERIEIDIIGRDRSGKKTLDDTARAADRAGTSLDHLGQHSGQLKAKISETEIQLKKLIKEFDATQDVTLFRQIRRDRSTLSMLVSMEKQLKELENGAKRAGDGIFEVLGAIPARLKGAAIVGAIAAAPLLLPALGAAVGGAVLGAAGTGGIVGGVIAAAQDERVATAGGELGEKFVTGFAAAGRVFINPLLDQMALLERAEDIVLADLASGFASLTPVIKPLAEGLEGLVENLDLDDLFGDSLPFVRTIANELPNIGDALSDMFDSIAEGSDGAVMGLESLLFLIEDTIRFVGEFIRVTSNIYEWLVRTGNEFTDFGEKALNAFAWVEYIPGVGQAFALYRDHVTGLHADTQDLIDGFEQATDAGNDWRGSLAEQAKSAQEAADEAKAYEDALTSLFNKIIGLKDAQLAYNRDLIDLRKELKDGAKTLAINTEEGIKNQKAILDLVRDIKALREEHLANGMAVERANGLYEQQMKQLIELAVHYGLNRREVMNLVGALADVPETVSGWIEVHNLDPSLKHAIALNKQIDELDGRVARATVITEFASYRAGERDPSGSHAAGGPELGGRAYLVGEHGPELRTETGSGYVHSAAQTRMLLSGLSGGSSAPAARVGGEVSVNVSVQPSAHARDLMGQLVLEMLRVDASFRSTMASYVGTTS